MEKGKGQRAKIRGRGKKEKGKVQRKRRLLTADSMHGYGLAQRLKLLSRDVLQVGESSLYPALQ